MGGQRSSALSIRGLIGCMLATSAFVVAAAPAPAAPACTRSWAGAVNGDWSDPAKWSPNGAPLATDDVCIQVAGTYTVTFGGAAAVRSLWVGQSGAGVQTLDVRGGVAGHATLTLTNASAVGGHGRVTLTAAAGGWSAQLASATAAPVLTNNGVIVSTSANGGGRALSMSVTNRNTVQINAPTVTTAARTFTNGKTVSVASGAYLAWGAGTFVNSAGGSIATSGDGYVSVDTGTFNAGDGTTSGVDPVRVVNGHVVYSGAGPSQVRVLGASNTLSGDLAAGQTLLVEGGPAGHASLGVLGSFTNAGVIRLMATPGWTAALASVNPGVTLVNSGTVAVDAADGGSRYLSIPIANTGTLTVDQTTHNTGSGNLLVNHGTITVADGASLDWGTGTVDNGVSGSIVAVGNGNVTVAGGAIKQGDGATSGADPLIVVNGTLTMNATLAPPPVSRVDLRGDSTLVGTIKGHQTVVIDAASAHAIVHRTTNLTVSGALELRSNGLGFGATLDATGHTVTIGGTLTVRSNTGARSINGSVVNKKNMTVEQNITLVVNGSFTQLATGKLTERINATGQGQIHTTGALGLAGTMAVAADAGWWPTVGGVHYLVLDGPTRLGTFSSITGLSRGSKPIVFSPSYLPAGLELVTS